jgi:hypothetical protein
MGLAVMVVAIAVSAPHFASAASTKVSGFWRFRGISSDNADRDDTGTNDALQKSDALIRPRWTFKSLKGKIVALYELDFDSSGFAFATAASSTGRASVGTNRYILDFAIPGTKARFRIGKTDWISPDKEVIASSGQNRVGGWGLRGKLSKSLKFELWNSQTTDGNASASDDNDYLASLTWTSPGLKISPYVVWEKYNAETAGTVAVSNDTTERDIWFYGVTADAKFGKIKLTVTGVMEDGTLDFGRGVNATGRADTDIQGYILLIRSWLDLGRGLKVGFYGHFTPGDDDITSTTGDLGTQPDGKLTRFVPPKRGGSCRLKGPQLFTRRRYNSVASGLTAESQCLNGDGGARMNGAQVYELLFKYKAAKNITISGNYSLIRSAAARSNIDANNDGDVTDAGDSTFGDSKNVGNELDLAVRWDIYKGLRTIISYAHLFAGDYGKDTTATRDLDDTWMLVWELTHAF